MHAADLLTRAIALTLIPTTVFALMRRRLYRACVVFLAYLVMVWLGDVLPLLWPSRFFGWTFWQLKETLLGGLKLGVAVEIAVLAYHAFPRAGVIVMRGLLAVLALSLAVFFASMAPSATIAEQARAIQPLLANTTLIAFCLVWALLIWYRIPLHFVHRILLRGFVTYLLLHAAANGLVMSWGWRLHDGVRLVDTVSYDLLLLYWTWQVWRTPDEEDPFLRELQPWRARL